ncbi:hypothetical protein [Haloechinothrix salitolerans]|uniref:Zinc-ribbon domain-containing protein n=1 Tax=Haloechinothrix salitolerans TaxID=926830 RepID=A0ABW2CBV4_9PSEU
MSLPIFPGDFDDDPGHVCPECGDPMPDDEVCGNCVEELQTTAVSDWDVA